VDKGWATTHIVSALSFACSEACLEDGVHAVNLLLRSFALEAFQDSLGCVYVSAVNCTVSPC
jgi:hypothetical protein